MSFVRTYHHLKNMESGELTLSDMFACMLDMTKDIKEDTHTMIGELPVGNVDGLYGPLARFSNILAQTIDRIGDQLSNADNQNKLKELAERDREIQDKCENEMAKLEEAAEENRAKEKALKERLEKLSQKKAEAEQLVSDVLTAQQQLDSVLELLENVGTQQQLKERLEAETAVQTSELEVREKLRLQYEALKADCVQIKQNCANLKKNAEKEKSKRDMLSAALDKSLAESASSQEEQKRRDEELDAKMGELEKRQKQKSAQEQELNRLKDELSKVNTYRARYDRVNGLLERMYMGQLRQLDASLNDSGPTAIRKMLEGVDHDLRWCESKYLEMIECIEKEM